MADSFDFARGLKKNEFVLKILPLRFDSFFLLQVFAFRDIISKIKERLKLSLK